MTDTGFDDLPPSILSHVSIGTDNLPRAVAFYDAVLGALAIGRRMEIPEAAVAYGRAFPEFWVQRPFDGGPAGIAGNGIHIAFLATDPAQVDAFYATGLAQGGSCEGPPGPRPDYHAGYYAAFLRDLDGNKIEAHSFNPDAG